MALDDTGLFEDHAAEMESLAAETPLGADGWDIPETPSSAAALPIGAVTPLASASRADAGARGRAGAPPLPPPAAVPLVLPLPDVGAALREGDGDGNDGWEPGDLFQADPFASFAAAPASSSRGATSEDAFGFPSSSEPSAQEPSTDAAITGTNSSDAFGATFDSWGEPQTLPVDFTPRKSNAVGGVFSAATAFKREDDAASFDPSEMSEVTNPTYVSVVTNKERPDPEGDDASPPADQSDGPGARDDGGGRHSRGHSRETSEGSTALSLPVLPESDDPLTSGTAAAATPPGKESPDKENHGRESNDSRRRSPSGKAKLRLPTASGKLRHHEDTVGGSGRDSIPPAAAAFPEDDHDDPAMSSSVIGTSRILSRYAAGRRRNASGARSASPARAGAAAGSGTLPPNTLHSSPARDSGSSVGMRTASPSLPTRTSTHRVPLSDEPTANQRQLKPAHGGGSAGSKDPIIHTSYRSRRMSPSRPAETPAQANVSTRQNKPAIDKPAPVVKDVDEPAALTNSNRTPYRSRRMSPTPPARTRQGKATQVPSAHLVGSSDEPMTQRTSNLQTVSAMGVASQGGPRSPLRMPSGMRRRSPQRSTAEGKGTKEAKGTQRLNRKEAPPNMVDNPNYYSVSDQHRPRACGGHN